MQCNNMTAVGEINFTSEPTVRPPGFKRCDLTIQCPVTPCDRTVANWFCAKCKAIVEYGTEDGNFHCLCGAVDPSDCLFTCGSHDHQAADADRLKNLLAGLEAPREYNILILGETGVGKSTFINALANYLSYATLKDALNEKLITVIPNEFTITDDNFESVVIRNGPDTHEEDFTAGHSATQKTKVHRFYFGSTVMRIIDTPGVGDVRGASQDRKNFEDILNAVSNLDTLHGIIVLLKPNSARLTITFRYCIEELLGRLHSSATDNIIFGFTNTRSTNFRPGETMPSLLEHLERTEVEIKCTKENVFCFDSEGYRFMAAHFHGIKFDDDLLDSYSKSWDFSVREVARLISYIKQLTPHSTDATLSLNDARMLVMKLGKPLAEVTKNIASKIDNYERDEKRIERLDEDNASLEDGLFVTVEDLEAKQLDHPRTVCTHPDCVTTTQHNESSRIIYETVCHDPCCLEEVSTETTNNPQLSECSAMVSGRCKICSHSYREHKHITYELVTQKKRVENEAVKEMMHQYASSREVKAQMIEGLKEEIHRLKDEGSQILKLAASFGVFLANNSMTTCSDPISDYFDFLISEEKKKPDEFIDERLLRSLKASIRCYARELARLNKAVKRGEETEVLEVSFIQESMHQLSSLSYSGPFFHEISRIAARPPAGNLREVTYRVKEPTSDNLIFRALSSFCPTTVVQSSPSEGPVQPQNDLLSDGAHENNVEPMDTEEIATECFRVTVNEFTEVEKSTEASFSAAPDQGSKQSNSEQTSPQEQKIQEEEQTRSMTEASPDIQTPEEPPEQMSAVQCEQEKQNESEPPLTESPTQLENERVDSYIRRQLRSMKRGLSDEDRIQMIIDGLQLEYQATTYGKEFTGIHMLIAHLKKIEAEL